MRKVSDGMMLLTLVDFLMQIIFLTMFILSVYAAKYKQENISSTPGVVKAFNLAGMANIVDLVNEASRLVPIDQLKDINGALKEFRDVNDLKNAARFSRTVKDTTLSALLGELERLGAFQRGKELEEALRKFRSVDDLQAVASLADRYPGGIKDIVARLGRDKPSCIVSETGNISFLFTVTAYDDHFVISNRSETFLDLEKKKNFTIEENEELSFAKFAEVFSRVINGSDNCRYYVRYVKRTDKESVRQNVENHFYILKIGS